MIVDSTQCFVTLVIGTPVFKGCQPTVLGVITRRRERYVQPFSTNIFPPLLNVFRLIAARFISDIISRKKETYRDNFWSFFLGRSLLHVCLNKETSGRYSCVKMFSFTAHSII